MTPLKETIGLKVILDAQKVILNHLIDPDSVSKFRVKDALEQVKEVSKYINILYLDEAQREAIENLKKINKSNE